MVLERKFWLTRDNNQADLTLWFDECPTRDGIAQEWVTDDANYLPIYQEDDKEPMCPDITWKSDPVEVKIISPKQISLSKLLETISEAEEFFNAFQDLYGIDPSEISKGPEKIKELKETLEKLKSKSNNYGIFLYNHD